MIKLALVGFASLFTVTLSTRAVTKDSYFNGLFTSLLAGTFYWITLGIAVPKLNSVTAGVVYVLGSTTGRILAMWICRNYLESGWEKKVHRWFSQELKVVLSGLIKCVVMAS